MRIMNMTKKKLMINTEHEHTHENYKKYSHNDIDGSYENNTRY